MFSEHDIKRMTTNETFHQGERLFKQGAVWECNLYHNDGEKQEFLAQVEGDKNLDYEIEGSFDWEKGMIVSVDCACIANETFPGICKHCVAALLEVADQMKKKTTAKQGIEGLTTDEIIQKGVCIPTTQAMKTVLERKALQRTLPTVQKELLGQVQLKPIVELRKNETVLEFQIGISRMYIVRDVFSFVEHMKQNEEYEYGTQLQFYHCREVFDETSRSLIDFLISYCDCYLQNYQKGAYLSPDVPSQRYLYLNIRELEEFLLAMGQTPFLANVGQRGEMEYVVTEEKLPHVIRITGSGNGISVKEDDTYRVTGHRYDLYFRNQKVYMELRQQKEDILDFQECMNATLGHQVFIAREDIPCFCRELLPTLRENYDCEMENFSEEDYTPKPVKFEIYLDAPQLDLVTCEVYGVYDDKKYSVYERNTDFGIRDIAAEMIIGERIAKYCNAYDEEQKRMVASKEEKIYMLLTKGVDEAKKLGEVFISNALKKIAVRGEPSVTVGVSLAGDLLNITMTSDEMSKEKLLDILSRYSVKKSFYRLKNGDFIRMEGEGISVITQMKQDLNLTEFQMKQEVIQVPKYRALYMDEHLVDRDSFHWSKSDEFSGLIDRMKTVEDNEFTVPACLEHTLREYQKQGFLWLKILHYNGFGGILADDMGLGKTLQVITFLQSEMEQASEEDEGLALIVTPASLVYNWENEIHTFAPELSVKTVTGTVAERKKTIQGASHHDILLTSYDLLRRDVERYENVMFAYQIIDEAQFIKNQKTKAARAVKKIRAGFKVALTGTPVENRLSELWSIFDYLMPGFLYSYIRFRQELEQPIVQDRDNEALERLQKMIGPFVLRRLKKDVLKDLPDKLEKSMYGKFHGEQQKLYDAHVKRMQMMLAGQTAQEFKKSKIEILSELTRLRQICCDPALVYDDYEGESAKLELCIDMIQNAVEGGHKILVFSQFTSMLKRIKARLKEAGITYYTITGKTDKERRVQLVEDFNHNATNVFLISLKAGGTGLNLTAADVVIHYDPWWNFAVQNQATDRAHRIGQRHVVNVYKLVMKGSIEENIISLQERKKDLAEQVLGGDNISGASFTREEIMELLQ